MEEVVVPVVVEDEVPACVLDAREVRPKWGVRLFGRAQIFELMPFPREKELFGGRRRDGEG